MDATDAAEPAPVADDRHVSFRVCTSIDCRNDGARDCLKALGAHRKRLGEEAVSVKSVACLGACGKGPNCAVYVTEPGKQGETRLRPRKSNLGYHTGLLDERRVALMVNEAGLEVPAPETYPAPFVEDAAATRARWFRGNRKQLDKVFLAVSGLGLMAFRDSQPGLFASFPEWWPAVPFVGAQVFVKSRDTPRAKRKRTKARESEA